MFSQREKSYLATSRLAREEMKIYDQLLGIRIQLQKSLDTANQLPVGGINPVDNSGEVDDVKEVLTKKLEGIIADLVTMDEGDNKEDGSDNDILTWKCIARQQRDLEEDSWNSVLNKLHARLNFGSENARQKMKVFGSSFFDQVDEFMTNDHRIIEKSRMLQQESNRIVLNTDENKINRSDSDNDNDSGSNNDNDSDSDSNFDDIRNAKGNDRNSKKRKYDMEVYEDRSFYSVLLKVESIIYIFVSVLQLYFTCFSDILCCSLS